MSSHDIHFMFNHILCEDLLILLNIIFNFNALLINLITRLRLCAELLSFE